MSAQVLIPQKVLHEVFGLLLIGTWFSSMVFALEILQAFQYFILFDRDRPWIRGLVVLMLAVDLMGACAACGLAYTYLVVGWGDLEQMARQNLFFPIYSIASTTVVLLMHGFLIRRYLTLSKKPVVAAILALPALTAFVGGSLVTWALGAKYTRASDRPKQVTFVTVWLTASVVADIFIAVALIYELARVKTTFKDTRSMLRRLIRNAVLSGAFTAFLASMGLGMFLMDPNTNYSLPFTLCICHASSITVLYNLNERKRVDGRSSRGQTSNGTSIPLDTHVGQNLARTGIAVHQVSVVHYETSKGDDMEDATSMRKHAPDDIPEP